MPASNLKELIAWLKENPDKASQGTSGVGGYSHLAGVFFQKLTGTRFQFVPYRGTAMNDLVAGHVDLMIDQTSNALPQVRNGNIKAYAVAANRRFAEAADIPTVDEAGLPGFHFSHWYALFAPKNTAKTVIGKLNAAVVEALNDLAVRQRLVDLGQEIFPREQQAPEIARNFPQGRDRQMVADHQGGRHRGGGLNPESYFAVTSSGPPVKSSPPTISAFGSGCCSAPCTIPQRKGASLPHSAGTHPGFLAARRHRRLSGARDGTMALRAAWPALRH